MKSALQGLSVAANVVLLAVVVAHHWPAPPADRHPTVAVSSPARPATSPGKAPRRAAAPVLATATPGAGHALPSLDPATLAQLAALGFTRDVMVSALLERFHHSWDEAFTALEVEFAPRRVPEHAYIELARTRDADRIRTLQAALGESGYAAWHKDQTLRQLNATGIPLSPGEAERAYQLQRDFDDEYREMQMAMEDGIADPAEAAALQAEGRTWLDQQLEQLLGRDRLDAMRGLADPVADVRRAMGDLDPTVDQARAVLAVDSDYRAREAALARQLEASPASATQLEAAVAALAVEREGQLRRIFGPAAYDAMRRQQDPTYQKLQQFAGVWQLDDHQIGSTYETLRAAQAEADRTRLAATLSEKVGQPVNWSEVNQAIEQRRRQAEQGLQALLGEQRLHRLRQNGLLAGG